MKNNTDMVLIGYLDAIQLYILEDANEPVYLLHDDGSESLVHRIEDIFNHHGNGGEFMCTKEVAEKHG